MNNKTEVNKITALSQHKELESKLFADAKHLDDSIRPQLQEELLSKLAHQDIPSQNTQVDNRSIFNLLKLNPSKLAIAASLVLTILAVQLFNQAGETDRVQKLAIQENKQHQIEIKSNVEIKSNALIASNHLGKEYSAILADVEKIKHSIVSL